MLADDPPASLLGVPLWWQTPASLSGALQTSQPFRAGAKERCYALLPDEDDEERLHFSRNDEGLWTDQHNLLRNLDLTYGPRIQTWGTVNYREELVAMAGREDLDLRQCAMRYGEVRLRENTQDGATTLIWGSRNTTEEHSFRMRALVNDNRPRRHG